MNKHLLKYKKFCLDVFNHEVRHSNKLSSEDILMDASEGSFLTNFVFCLKHPTGFSQFIPIGMYNKKLFIDLNLIVVYIIAFILLIGYFALN